LLPVPVPHVGEHGTPRSASMKQLRHTALVGPIVVVAGVTVAGAAGAAVVVVATVVVVVGVVVVVVVLVAVHGIKSYVILRLSLSASHTIAGCWQVDGLPLIRLLLAETGIIMLNMLVLINYYFLPMESL